MFYFARYMNIIFNSLLAKLVKYDVHTNRHFYHILLLCSVNKRNSE